MSDPPAATRTPPLRIATDVSVARSLAEVEALRTGWGTLAPTSIESDIDYYLTDAQTRPAYLRPHVVVLGPPDRPRALLAARLERIRLESRLGWWSVYAPPVLCLTAVYRGFRGDLGDAAGRLLVQALWEALDGGEADVAFLTRLRVDSPAYAAAKAVPPWPFRQLVGLSMVHRRLELPSSFDEYIRSRSRNTRHMLKRHTKKLMERYGSTLVIERLDRRSDLDRVLAELEFVTGKSYQRRLGVGFLNDDRTRQLTALALSRGWYRAYILYIGGTPRAYWTGHIYGSVFATGVTGYDSDYGDYNLGSFLLLRVFEDLCSDDAVRAVDFGFDDAAYKRSFSSEGFVEQDVCMFAPTLRGIRANAARTAVSAANEVVRRAMRERPIVRKLRRARRERSLAPLRGR
jgi:CelD/BcsL family acetyltransferase involved in cellulose biosynthesis